MQNKSKIQENALRSLIKNEIKRLLEQDEEQASSQQSGTEPTAEKPVEDPKQDDQGREQALTKISSAYVKSLKNNLQNITTDELSNAFESVMNQLGYSKEAKINVLRAIKNSLQV